MLESFSISRDTSLDFARASGDFNPLHVDPMLARRYQFGGTVVHGVCATLKALDTWAQHQQQDFSLRSINVRYSNPIRNGQLISCSYKQLAEREIRLELGTPNGRAQVIDIVLAETIDDAPRIDEAALADSVPAPIERAFSEAADLSDKISLVWEKSLVSSLFPALKKQLPDYQVATLLGMTNIVGMHCPGLHSVFTRLEVQFSDDCSAFTPQLEYSVNDSDERFSSITIDVDNGASRGQIEAMFRAPPVEQIPFRDVLPLCTECDLSSTNALIIGGSRGIGETTAKIIAAAGGRVTITYASGRDDAEKVAADIRGSGKDCSIAHYNVLDPNAGSIELAEDNPFTHIYYFASPLIEKNGHSLWSAELFAKYSNFYLDGFARLVGLFVDDKSYRKQALTFFVPSSVFIDEEKPGFGEYIAAKLSAEFLVKQLGRKYKHWTFQTPRLPQMLTDQTSSVPGIDARFTVETMLSTILSPGQP